MAALLQAGLAGASGVQAWRVMALHSTPFYVGVGRVIAPSAAEETRAAYLANTPVG